MNGWFFQEQLKGFKSLGYTPQATLLHAVEFGLPQDRKRVFIVGIRNDLSKSVDYNFPKPTHGKGLIPYRTLKDAIGDMPLDPKGEYEEDDFHGHYLTRNRKRRWDQTSFTIVASSAHVPLHPAGEPMIKIEKDKWALQGNFNRRLSWKECVRLQGLPDYIAPSGGLKDKYRVIGNAVPPIFAYQIIKPIIDFENSSQVREQRNK